MNAPTASTDASTVSPATLRSWVEQPPAGTGTPMVVDVRSAAEYEAQHIRGSYHVPVRTLAEHTAELARLLDTGSAPVVLVCRSGVRAEQARRHLTGAGLDHAHVLDGGVPAYAEAGGDVVRGRPAWALERQVRLGAGSLVLTGLLAGRYLAPAGRLLSGAVGTGLVLSALTDTCTMGAVLARLPFNRAAADPTVAETLAALERRPGTRPS
ncbi:rhodanese-like domain-containing protein [Pseudonocardia sp. ICBG162]|uniref:rhodanese-like domain-containing protein n=1 Tax=Pseudonocardia sp. ICBG162 TaxID=2846761 RepID=UPI001CF6E3B6|nr:rhodanese-like domain-containing protein [Pseudonocardia sp. ICBG162]